MGVSVSLTDVRRRLSTFTFPRPTAAVTRSKCREEHAIEVTRWIWSENRAGCDRQVFSFPHSLTLSPVDLIKLSRRDIETSFLRLPSVSWRRSVRPSKHFYATRLLLNAPTINRTSSFVI